MNPASCVFDGGPAFPVSWDMDGEAVAISGMSLRDYFAAKAMDTLLHSSKVASGFGYMEPDDVARRAYEYADAMLKAREKVSGR